MRKKEEYTPNTLYLACPLVWVYFHKREYLLSHPHKQSLLNLSFLILLREYLSLWNFRKQEKISTHKDLHQHFAFSLGHSTAGCHWVVIDYHCQRTCCQVYFINCLFNSSQNMLGTRSLQSILGICSSLNLGLPDMCKPDHLADIKSLWTWESK